MGFIKERYFLKTEEKPAFVRQASPFEDFVVRCVRYAFANIPPKVGRVFFSKRIAIPWLRWRMLRHGYLRCPVHWREYRDVSIGHYQKHLDSFRAEYSTQKKIKGVWAISDPVKKPDIVVYYAHGK